MSFTLEVFDKPEIPEGLGECRRVLRLSRRIVGVGMSKVSPKDPMVCVFEWAHQHFPKTHGLSPHMRALGSGEGWIFHPESPREAHADSRRLVLGLNFRAKRGANQIQKGVVDDYLVVVVVVAAARIITVRCSAGTGWPPSDTSGATGGINCSLLPAFSWVIMQN
jgi:hypothetical protein